MTIETGFKAEVSDDNAIVSMTVDFRFKFEVVQQMTMIDFP